MAEGNSHFLAAIERIDGGHVIETADDQLREVVSAVNRTGKKGTVTVTLEVEPNGEMGFAATAKVSAKAPQLSFGKSFFFQGPGGDLTRTPPDYVQKALLNAGEKSDG